MQKSLPLIFLNIILLKKIKIPIPFLLHKHLKKPLKKVKLFVFLFYYSDFFYLII